MIFRPSGGLLYHWRAWREGRRWQEFNRSLADWLEDWKCPPGGELVILGASGGYTLPTEWLKRFDRLTAYDLDRLAPLLFRLRHPGLRVTFHFDNVFWENSRLSLAPLRRILQRHPDATLLFSNVLGQLLLEGKAGENEWYDFLKSLRQTTEGRKWASYHDQFTHERGEIIDHLMSGGWSQGLERRQFRWQLNRDCLHIIEGVRT